MSAFTESTVEQAVLDWMESIDWRVANDSDTAAETPIGEDRNDCEVALGQRLGNALLTNAGSVF